MYKVSFLSLFLFLILFFIFYNNNEHYTSLSTIYPNIIKRSADVCNECGGLCGDCNHVNPLICANKSNIYGDGSPSKFKCIDDKTMNELISANYVYIYSDAFNKLLSFDVLNIESNVYIDSKKLNTNECLTTDQYENYCKSNKDYLPQKWRINIKNFMNPKLCLVTISSLSCDGIVYYLSANKQGKLSVNPFSGSDEQVWQIIRNNESFLIKSHPFCIYLSALNNGYTKKDAGIVSLDNIVGDYVGKEMLWKIMTCGDRKIDTLPKKEIYRPLQSPTDSPMTNDDVNVKSWSGRSTWMKEFDDEWNGGYMYDVRVKNNKLEQIKNRDEYKIVTTYNNIKMESDIKMNKDGGTVKIEMLGDIGVQKNNISGQLLTKDGKSDVKTYDTYKYVKKTLDFKVKSGGANVLHGIAIATIDGKAIGTIDALSDSISDTKAGETRVFLERLPNNRRQIRVTVSDNSGNVLLQEIMEKK